MKPRAKDMITFQIAGYLTEFTNGRAEIKLDSSVTSVGEALDKLWAEHIGLRDRVLNEQRQVRPFRHQHDTVVAERLRPLEEIGQAQAGLPGPDADVPARNGRRFRRAVRGGLQRHDTVGLVGLRRVLTPVLSH